MSRSLTVFLFLLVLFSSFPDKAEAQVTHQVQFSESDLLFEQRDGFVIWKQDLEQAPMEGVLIPGFGLVPTVLNPQRHGPPDRGTGLDNPAVELVGFLVQQPGVSRFKKQTDLVFPVRWLLQISCGPASFPRPGGRSG